MVKIDTFGRVIHPRVKLSIIPNIEIRHMEYVNGIIIHQTDSKSAQSTLDTYKGPEKVGAHFLIDKDGTIYQTASIYKMTHHVGMLRVRCQAERRCKPVEVKKFKGMKWSEFKRYSKEQEIRKRYPDRHPFNADSIGIELVGEALPREERNQSKRVFEAVTDEQNMSLQWLVFELTVSLGLSMKNIFRHPIVSYKNPTEAETARW